MMPSWDSWREREGNVSEFYWVTLTHYSSTVDQTDSDPWVGRCGKVGHGTIGVSRDLLDRLPCGTNVRIEGRVYTVMDTMHPRWRMRVDRWMPSRSSANRAGKRKVLMEVLP